MRVSDTREIAIVGAGLAGTLQAVLLAQRGFSVRLFERNPDPRAGKIAAGRSINLALADRGRHALERAGILAEVDRYTIPMRGRMLHDENGGLTLQPYGARPHEVIFSTHRARLNLNLLEAACATGRIECHFNHRLERIDWTNNRLEFDDGSGGGHEYPFEVVIGADGGGSAVRQAMNAEQDIGISEDLLDHGYRELTMPPAHDGGPAMDPNALHIWPRGGFMLIALANSDDSFTVTLFLPNEGDPSFASLESAAAQHEFMISHFPDAVALLPELERDFQENPVGLLGTVRCRQWHLGSKALLIGDAAHAVVPFHGQGMNAAFEDTEALMDCLVDDDQDWAEVFQRVQELRRDNANAIADMALENYVIMREAVRNPRFLLRKALEHDLERRHPNRFVARYSLVMFHRIPYAEAYRRGEAQGEILDTLLEDASALENVDFDRAARLVTERLEPIEEPRPLV